MENSKGTTHDIVVTVLGGCVNGVFTNIANARVVLVDWDNLNELRPSQHHGGVVAGWPLRMDEMPAEAAAAVENCD